MKKKDNNDFTEIVQLLIWAYKQGYMHAGAVLKDTIPDDKKCYQLLGYLKVRNVDRILSSNQIACLDSLARIVHSTGEFDGGFGWDVPVKKQGLCWRPTKPLDRAPPT